jgi:hypothetical protein
MGPTTTILPRCGPRSTTCCNDGSSSEPRATSEERTVLSEQGPSLRHASMASRSCQCRASTSRVDCKGLSDSLEGGGHAALLFSRRRAIREYNGRILSPNSYRMAGRQFHQSGGGPLILAKGNRLTSPEVRQTPIMSSTAIGSRSRRSTSEHLHTIFVNSARKKTGKLKTPLAPGLLQSRE